MEGLKLIPYIFLIIAIAGVIGGAVAITNQTFATTMTDCTNSTWTFDEASQTCINSSFYDGPPSGRDGTNLTDQRYVSVQTGSSIGTIAAQMPTIAIIAIMTIIISIIAGVMVYIKYFS